MTNEDLTNIMSNLSENAKIALQKADFYSKKYNNGYMGTEHLLLGIIAQDVSAGASILRQVGASLESLEKALGVPAKEVRGYDMAMMSLSEPLLLTLRMAAAVSEEIGYEVIGTEHLLQALITQEKSRAMQLLKKIGVKYEDLDQALEDFFVSQENQSTKTSRSAKSKSRSLHWLNRYGQNLTELARQHKLDNVIGRDAEIERVITVLSRRTKSNPVLIGEAGVGKTAIVEGLALKIAKGDVPSHLVSKNIYQVDLSSVVAGTKFRGEFEERIKGIIDEATSSPNIILFIDELHLLSGAGSGEGSMDAANILKPALARGQICLIGATTSEEYRKLEKDKALARRFQTVLVEEPSASVTLQILKGVKKHYEKHHSVLIPDELLPIAINMSSRYINDRFMPDKVIDVIDEAAAIAKVALEKKGGSEFRKLTIQHHKFAESLEKAIDENQYDQAAEDRSTLLKIERRMKELEKSGQNQDPKLTEEDLAKAISLKTGIPVSKVHGSEVKLLVNLESHLKKIIIGQDEAISAVSKAIRRGRSGIADPRRPIGSFLFMGPTGVGKTELARAIAREVFGGENALIKIDMSEFGEKHNVSRLIGAPAGYVGYDDGGKLTEMVRRRPYSVVLFDEIEKAHPEVFNILLQILEDGTLTDGQGNTIKFNNTIIILTSNLGSAHLYQDPNSALGFISKHRSLKPTTSDYEHSKAIAMRELKKSMRPELVNRLDSVLVFHSLSPENVEKIFDNLIDELKKRLVVKKIGLVITPTAKKFLIEKGYSAQYGARPLRRTIEDEVESLLSEAIISDTLKAGDIAEITLRQAKLHLKVSNEGKISASPAPSKTKTSKSAKKSSSSKTTSRPASKPSKETSISSGATSDLIQEATKPLLISSPDPSPNTNS